jgi:hypothetical protein
VLTIVGALCVGVGVVGFVQAANVCDGGCHDVQGLGAVPWTVAGVAGTAFGVIGLSVGIPLWVIGSQEDPADGASSQQAGALVPASRQPPPASLRVSAGPGGAALTLAF